MQNNPLLNQLAFDIVKDKAIEDKTKEIMKEQEEKQKEQEKLKKLKEEDEDDDFDEVDSEEERIMKAELEKMKGEALKKKEQAARRAKEKYGQYREIIETEFLDTCLKNKRVVCHFYHNDFERCKILDNHIKKIANEHPETLFIRINAEKTPFFTAKLNIRVLPTLIMFVDGKAIGRFIGFQDFGMTDDFPTINISRKLVLYKMILPKNKAEKGEININKKGGSDDEDSDY
jgi:thiol-disulfide isomerase/thioredoxin